MRECERVREKLAEYAVEGLRAGVRRRVEAHLGDCAACRAELSALARTGALLDSLEAEDAPRGTWEAVRVRIAERPRATVRRSLRRAWAMGLVVFVLVALGVLMVGPPEGERPLTVAAAEADEEMQATMDEHLSAVWAAPLSDVAGVGLRMAELEDDG